MSVALKFLSLQASFLMQDLTWFIDGLQDGVASDKEPEAYGAGMVLSLCSAHDHDMPDCLLSLQALWWMGPLDGLN